jgi:hypothetical protein
MERRFGAASHASIKENMENEIRSRLSKYSNDLPLSFGMDA